MGCVMFEMFTNNLPFTMVGSMGSAEAHQDGS